MAGQVIKEPEEKEYIVCGMRRVVQLVGRKADHAKK
jgi:hypothetical protein